MKNKGIFKFILVLIGCVVGVYLLFNFFDTVLDGVLREWLNSILFYEAYNPGIDSMIYMPNWHRIRLFAFWTVMVLVLAVSALVFFISARRARSAVDKERKLAIAGMESLIDGKGEEPLPQEYASVEYQLQQMCTQSLLQQQTLEAEAKQKNDLIVYLAHDMKTPLASVIGYLNLLNEVKDMPEEQREKYTGIVLDKAYRLEELLDEFFDIARFNLQKIVLNKGEVNLSFMLRQMADEFYPILEPEGKRAEVIAEPDLTVLGDPDKLARVFNNILRNAAAYSYPGSVISIEAKEAGDWVEIVFANAGEGIPPQKLELIFDKFYRLDSSRSTATGGAGLGLAIAKEIVQAHGGEISAVSENKRTEFVVKLPK